MTYIGKTMRHLLVRMSEHLGIFYKTGKTSKYNPNKTTAVREHIMPYKHSSIADNFTIVFQANNDFEFLTKESLLVSHDKPLLNKQVKNFSLPLF